MKVYFVASIKGRKKFKDNYTRIIKTLEKLGHKVIEHTLKPSDDYVYSLSDQEKIKFYKKVLGWINESDIVIAEGSYPSLGIGFEISQALEKGKPVVLLYTEEGATHFLQGIQSDKLILIKYELQEVEEVLKDIIEDAKDQMDVRFNFFISPRIGVYLDWIAKNKKLPRAVFLRKLIEDHMAKNKKYKA